jgi:hypothetical protein
MSKNENHMQRLEYHEANIPQGHVQPVCNTLGQDGWELVFAAPIMIQPTIQQANRITEQGGGVLKVEGPANQAVPGLYVLFKRRKSGDAWTSIPKEFQSDEGSSIVVGAHGG